MTSLLVGLLCVVLGLATVPFFPAPAAYLAFGWCMALALVNFIIAGVTW